MKPYLITYNYGQQSHFAYADSIAEARSYAANLLTYNRVSTSASLSIICVADEQIVFFKTGELTPGSLYAEPRRMSQMFDRLKSLIYGGMAPASLIPQTVSIQP